MNNTDLRTVALNKAIDISGPRPESNAILKDAELFYEFLKGDTPEPSLGSGSSTGGAPSFI